ncbi:MAG TPA: TonB-dependent receptor [Sphingopyxis sp.]|nr:TonB-dependent receptor [Sphingopyxis sp.]HMP44540.1 TonB-dependent receptor [Sphingopyxis sp.]
MHSGTISGRWIFLVGAAAGALSWQAPALAQASEARAAGAAADEDEPGVGIIIVTAQRRSENLQDVPAAVTAFSADDLVRYGVVDTMGLTGQTPGLQIKSSNGQTKPNVFLRGIGTNDFNVSASAAVGFYVDEVYQGLQSAQLFQVFDLKGVEVLRGPQGTLYGRNTTGGAVNFFTNKPDGTVEASGSVSYGRFDQLSVEAAAQAPLSEALSARVAGVYRSSNGDGRNLFTGERVNSFDSWSLRGLLRLAPEDNSIEWTLNVHGGIRNGEGPRYHFQRVDNGAFPDPVLPLIGVQPPYAETGSYYDGSWDLPQDERIENFGAALNGQIHFDGVTLHSVTGYEKVKAYVRFDSDASPLNYVNVEFGDDSWQLSQEFRLASDTSGPLTWMIGAYYYRDRVTADNRFDIGRFARELFGAPADLNDPTAPIDIGQRYTQRQRSLAGFGSISYRLSQALKLTGGLRYTSDRKTLDYRTTADSAIAIGIPYLIDIDRSRKWNAVTGNVVVDWKAGDDVLIYGSYNRGFKSGQYNASPFFNPDDVNSADPETVDAFEVGFKSQLADNRVRFNLSAFNNNYSNLQVFQFVPDAITGVPTSRYSNAGKARVRGVEFEIDAQPVSGLSLRLAGAILDAKYTRFIANPDDPATVPDETVDLSGNRLIASPKLNLSGGAEYRIPVGSWDLVPAYDFTYNSRQFFTPENLASLSQKAYWIHNASLSLREPGGRYGISLWARNFTGTRYNNEILPLPDFGVHGEIRGERATFGLTLSLKVN